MSGPDMLHLANGRMMGDTDRAAVRDIVSRAMAGDAPAGLTIHFHGGLVNYNAGVDIALKLDPVYRRGGAHPVFFVWESGLWETVRNNLDELAREHLFKLLWKRVANMAKRKLMQTAGMKSTGRLPPVSGAESDAAIEDALSGRGFDKLLGDEPSVPADLDELSPAEMRALQAELDFDMPLVNELRQVSASLRTPEEIAADAGSRSVLTLRSDTRTLLDPAAVDRYIERPDPHAKGIISSAKFLAAVVKIVARVVRRYVNRRDHGFHATVVEEILREFYVANVGGAIWGLMKQDTVDAFQDDPEAYGGHCFLTELKAAWPPASPLRITLVGHSTGAIYIAEFLAAAEAVFGPGQGPVFDVVFLAPAATFERCAAMLAHTGQRIATDPGGKRRFRMFTMTDDNERRDGLIPKAGLIYPHSLLYFISGVLEKDGEGDMPLVGMQRYYDATRYPDASFQALAPFRDLVAAHPQHAVWSDHEGGDGLASTALSHGDFDEDELTRGSLVHILRHGF